MYLLLNMGNLSLVKKMHVRKGYLYLCFLMSKIIF